MREIHTHKITGVAEAVQVHAMDVSSSREPGHHYRLAHPLGLASTRRLDLIFPKGPPSENGPYGITDEALLAVIIDRLTGFQQGSLACEDNAVALEALRTALEALQRRTQERIKRGTKGTMVR